MTELSLSYFIFFFFIKLNLLSQNTLVNYGVNYETNISTKKKKKE